MSQKYTAAMTGVSAPKSLYVNKYAQTNYSRGMNQIAHNKNLTNKTSYSNAVGQIVELYKARDAATLDYKNSFNQAKAANESRYAEILAGYNNLQTNTNAQLDGLGDVARGDVVNSYNNAYAKSMQGLVNAGMANSTILPSVANSNSRQKSDALGRLNESLRREKLGYTTNITNNKLGFMERREDAYPNSQLYAQLMSQFGQQLGNSKTPNYVY